MSAEEAVDMGFADDVEDGTPVAASMMGAVAMVNGVSMDYSRFINLPKLPQAQVAQAPNDKKPIPSPKPEEKPTNGGASELTLEELKNQDPELYAEIVAVGVQQERMRMQALDDLLMPGNAAIIAEAKTSGASAADTAVAIIKAENDKRKKAGEKIKNDADEAGIDEVDAEDPADEQTDAKKTEQAANSIASYANEKRKMGR